MEGIIREHRHAALTTFLPYPAAALVIGVVLVRFEPMLAAFALGASAAWAWSTVQEVRGVRASVLWTYAWLQEDVTVTTDDEGLRLASARGASLMRWEGGIRVHSRPEFFVIRDESDDIAVLPKKYLAEAELLALNSRAVQRG